MIRARQLAALLALACVAMQLASGSALLASAVALALHADDHDHSVSVSAEEGHLHVVLAHGGADHRHDAAEADHGEPSVAQRDHVLEMSGEDAVSTSRRAAHDAAPPLALAVVLPSPAEPAFAHGSAPASRAHVSALLKSVVLRL